MAEAKNITQIEIDKLIPYVNNAKKHSDEQVAKIAASIREFGFVSPVLIDKENNIIAGHGRVMAARKLGLEKVPCVFVEGLTDAQRKAYILADNRLGELADWDMELVGVELESLEADGFDTDLTGFDIDNVLDGYKPPIEVEQDEIPEEVQTKAKLGDIYQLGEHRLMCGSSVDEDDVAALMDGVKARMLFTSPPYADMRTYEGGKNLSVDFLAQFIPTYRPYTDYQVVNLGIKRQGGEIVPYWDTYIDSAHKAGYKLMAWNVWDKGSAGSVASETAFVPIYHEWLFLFGAGAGEITAEFMMVFGTDFFDINRTVEKKAASIGIRSKTSKRNPDGSMGMHTQGDTSRPYKQMGSIVTVPPETAMRDHPAPFPVGLPAAYIQAFTKQGDVVIEPFSGSGTTMIACEQTGRKCYAMELEPKYVDLAIARWEEYTGNQAILVKDGGCKK